MFSFKKYAPFSDGEIDVRILETRSNEFQTDWLPAYHFGIFPTGTRNPVGYVDLRIGYINNIVWYGGHIGYRVNERYRGHHYAAKACALIAPVAKDHGMDVIWITCNPDNWPSRRTCEYLGLKLVDIVNVPEDNDMYRRGERQKCRYRWILY